MKGQVIGAPSKAIRKPSAAVGGASSSQGTARRVVVEQPVGSAATIVKKQSVESMDEDFAVILHRLVCANLPNLTLVDDIPTMYQQMQRSTFPKVAGGVASVLTSQFPHILSFTRMDGKLFASPLNPPETSVEGIVAIHKRARAGHQPVAAAAVVAATPSRPQLNEQTLALVSQGVKKVLQTTPSIGQAINMNELRSQISKGFFDMFKMPIALEGGKVLVDPITILQKGEGTLFTKLVEEPVTGHVSVKAIISTSSSQSGSKQIGGSMSGAAAALDPQVTEGLKRLRFAIKKNIDLIDVALARPGAAGIDVELQKSGIETMISEQFKFTEVLTHMFPASRTT